MAGVQTLSGHILAKSLLPELKTSLKRSLGALVLVKNQKFRGKKFTFFFFLVLAKKSRFLERFFYCSLSGLWGGKMGGGSFQRREGTSAWSGGWVASAEMPFPWVAAPACGENFPAGAGGHLRPKTKKGTFFLQKEGGFGAFSVS